MMGREREKASRGPRSDALRNRERLLEAAGAVFGAGGAGASLEAVARTAGVGIGTLYRHFPTREALFEAVYRHDVDQLVDLAERLAADVSPTEALRRWLHASVGMIATKKGMIATLAPAADSTSDLYAESAAKLTGAVGDLLRRAVTAGEIRDDIAPGELMRVVVGLCYNREQLAWQATVVRLIDIFLDGLRWPPRDA